MLDSRKRCPLFLGTIARYDFDSFRDYFAGETNPNGIGSSGLFHSFDADGHIRYRFDANIGSPAISAIESGALILDDGTAIFGQDDGHVYALNGQGQLAWQFPSEASPKVVDVFDTTDGLCTYERVTSPARMGTALCARWPQWWASLDPGALGSPCSAARIGRGRRAPMGVRCRRATPVALHLRCRGIEQGLRARCGWVTVCEQGRKALRDLSLPAVKAIDRLIFVW